MRCCGTNPLLPLVATIDRLTCNHHSALLMELSHVYCAVRTGLATIGSRAGGLMCEAQHALLRDKSTAAAIATIDRLTCMHATLLTNMHPIYCNIRQQRQWPDALQHALLENKHTAVSIATIDRLKCT